MKKITKEYTLFTFDELSQEAKDKARTNFNADNDYMFLEGHITNLLGEQLDEYKITKTTDPKVYYSLSHCQGDGAMFEGTFSWNDYIVKIKHSGHYYHSNSKNIEIYDTADTGEEVSAGEEVYKTFEAIYKKICKYLEQQGYDFIEYEDSEENFQRLCEANEYTFLKDGTMFNE